MRKGESRELQQLHFQVVSTFAFSLNSISQGAAVWESYPGLSFLTDERCSHAFATTHFQ